MNIYFKLLAITVLTTLIFSCENKQTSKTSITKETKESIELQDLIGKTFEWNYPSLVYQITFKTDTTLFWKLIEGDFPGPNEGTENFIHSKLYDRTHYISWTENSGLGVYNVLDFNTNKLTTHGNHDGHMFVNPGNFKLLEK